MIRDMLEAELELRIGDAVASAPARVHYTDTDGGGGVEVGGIAVQIGRAWVDALLVTLLLGASEALHQAVADHAAGRREDARTIARAKCRSGES